MDPFADKLLVIGTFICLAGPGFASVDDAGRAYQTSGVAPWMVVAILGRELLVTSIRAVFEARGVNFAASWSGKIKMILQSGAIPTILLMLAFTPASPGSVSRLVILGIVWAAVIQTVWSGVPYILRAMRTRSDPTP